jgi:SAM-dependent methyltransferase
LPITFNNHDIAKYWGLQREQYGALLPNTGCWVARVHDGWYDKVSFRIRSGIDWSQDPPRGWVDSEDWELGRDLYDMGYGDRVFASSIVNTHHWGSMNYQSWPTGWTNETWMSRNTAKAGDPIHEHGFWMDDSLNGHYYDPQLAEHLAETFVGSSVVDLGCGIGRYVSYLSKREIDAIGLDGNPRTPEIASGNCEVADLAEPLNGEYVRDWAICLEVGEHIPKDFEPVLLDNIAKCCRRGAVVSWAVPGQPGRGHVNCRNPEHIISAMETRGLVYQHEESLDMREKSELPYFKNSIMVFHKGGNDDG